MIAMQDEGDRLTLSGDFSITGVNDQLPSLVEHLAMMAELAPGSFSAAHSYEIDLSEIQALDSCGCQLLAIFFGNLRRGGAARFSLKLGQEHREKIHLYGFDKEIFAKEHA
jgi:anti-anti-sigma regulatory factor